MANTTHSSPHIHREYDRNLINIAFSFHFSSKLRIKCLCIWFFFSARFGLGQNRMIGFCRTIFVGVVQQNYFIQFNIDEILCDFLVSNFFQILSSFSTGYYVDFYVQKTLFLLLCGHIFCDCVRRCPFCQAVKDVKMALYNRNHKGKMVIFCILVG